ncbi:MAG: ABC transporter permease subunit [Patulibacter minatonensis]
MRLPPVAVGQLLWLLLWPDSRWGGGPLGGLDWLYRTPAVVLAQTVLALPLVAALVAGGIDAVPRPLLAQARALGAGRRGIAALALREARPAVIGAVLAGFGTAVATVGAILIVGGDAGELTLATAALSDWTAYGLSRTSVASGTLLLGLFTVVAALATTFQHRQGPWNPRRS